MFQKMLLASLAVAGLVAPSVIASPPTRLLSVTSAMAVGYQQAGYVVLYRKPGTRWYQAGPYSYYDASQLASDLRRRGFTASVASASASYLRPPTSTRQHAR